jgi:hypothetical protein
VVEIVVFVVLEFFMFLCGGAGLCLFHVYMVVL